MYCWDGDAAQTASSEKADGSPVTKVNHFYNGYAALTNGNTRASADGGRNVKLQAVTLLARGNGYRYGRGPNRTPERN